MLDSPFFACYNTANFIRKSVAEAKYPEGRHPRERALLRFPYAPSGEKPFQVQTQSLRQVGAA